MRCPKCKLNRERVINSDEPEDGREIVRRRRCLACDHRWNTREVYANLLVSSPTPITKRRVGAAAFLPPARSPATTFSG